MYRELTKIPKEYVSLANIQKMYKDTENGSLISISIYSNWVHDLVRGYQLSISYKSHDWCPWTNCSIPSELLPELIKILETLK